ncbi:3473_t:CDS:2, partial [Paraglomus occultum]
LVELIVLNIGLEAGVIDGKVFAILVVMAIVTTCLTTPLALKVFRKSARQERPNLELSCTTIDYSKKNNILVVLNKAEFISSLMTLLQLLQPTASRRDSMSISHDGNNSNRSNGSDDTIMLHVLRLMELGQRLSAIMKSCESANIAHHDPIINVFHMFGRLNFFDVEATLSFRPFHKFADQVVQSAKQSSANLVIIPWNGAGSTAYDTPEDFYKPREYSDTNPQVAQFIQEAYRVIDGITVGVFIDRGLGMAPGRPGCRDVSISVFVPFVAGSDDREALLLLARLAENPRVDATVLRITKSTEPTDNDSRLIPVSTPTMRTVQINPDDTRTDEEGPVNPHIANLQKPPPAHHMSSASISVINYSTADRIASNAADELLIDKYFGPHGSLNSNPRVKYISLRSATPMQTAVEYAKDVVERKDLVIVGHGQHNVTYSHRDEWMEIIRQLRISSNDMRRSLGEMATAMLGGGVEASIFVVQGKKENR